jgi:hypothetical protein
MTDPQIRTPTAGFVAPQAINSELEDVFLRRFLNTLVSGIVETLESENVRPRWQPEPGNEPAFTTDWCAIGTVRRTRDTFAAELQIPDPDEDNDADDSPMIRVVRNEILEIIASFYGPNCDANGELFAMGLALAQNREALLLNGFGLVEVQDTRTVPALIKERWLTGVDVPFRMRRQQIYDYPIATIVAANGTLTLDDGEVIKIIVSGTGGYGREPYGEGPYNG